MEVYEIILLIVLSFLLIIICLTILSRIIYQRSLMASIVEIFLKFTCKKYDDEDVVKGFEKLVRINDKKYVLPKRLMLKKQVKEVDYKGMQLFLMKVIIQIKQFFIFMVVLM